MNILKIKVWKNRPFLTILLTHQAISIYSLCNYLLHLNAKFSRIFRHQRIFSFLGWIFDNDALCNFENSNNSGNLHFECSNIYRHWDKNLSNFRHSSLNEKGQARKYRIYCIAKDETWRDLNVSSLTFSPWFKKNAMVYDFIASFRPNVFRNLRGDSLGK